MLKWVLSMAIPDAPRWVTEEQARRTYYKKIAIEGYDPSLDDEDDDDDPSGINIESGGVVSSHHGVSSKYSHLFFIHQSFGYQYGQLSNLAFFFFFFFTSSNHYSLLFYSRYFSLPR